MTCNSLRPSTIVNGTASVMTYVRAGVNLPAAGIEEYIIIETGAIAANTNKLLETSLKDTVFKLESLWVDSSANTNFAIDFDILWGQSSIFKFSLNTSQLPFTFPPVIITGDLNILVKPQAAVDRILCYGKPVAIIDRLVFP